MASNFKSSVCQWFATGIMSSVMSLNVYPVKPPVWVERTAVGITVHSNPVAEIMGNAVVREHLPKQEMS